MITPGIREQRPDPQMIQVSVENTWGGWPWVAKCHSCRMSSPGQRQREEAWAWIHSHMHSYHEIV